LDVGTYPFFRQATEKMFPLLRSYDRVFCVSRASGHSLKQLTGIEPELHYNPINSLRIQKMAEEKAELPQECYVCAVGRLAPEKGFVRLIHVHKRLLDAGAPHKLVIVGEGNERESIENAIRQTGTQDSVVLAGYQSNPYPYMKNSRFLVCSSFTEALPVISMEALSLGVPIVSSAPSIGEVFGEENCGIITGGDDDSLFEGMYTMLTDCSYYAAAKQGAESRSMFFDGERMVKEVENAFLELVK
jgi:glycosyltransferase involved in cell wall biosynthesis